VYGARVPVQSAAHYVGCEAWGFSYRRKAEGGHGAPVLDSTGDALVLEASARASRTSLLKVYLWICAAVVVLSLLVAWELAAFLTLAAGVGAFFVRKHDVDGGTTRVYYDVDSDEIVARLAVCSVAGEALAHTTRLWSIYSASAVADMKYNAGASTNVGRTLVHCAFGSLPGIETNLGTFAISIGPQKLLFLPDRLLVQHGNHFGWASYESLTIEYAETRFIETGAVPPDARMVDRTYQFVNRDGGPDRRFANNPTLPVLSYGKLVIHSAAGLYIQLQSSNAGATHAAASALQELVRIAREGIGGRRDAAYGPPPSGAYTPPPPPTAPAYAPPPSAPRPVVAPIVPAAAAALRPAAPPTPAVYSGPSHVAPAAVQNYPRRFVGEAESLNVAGRTITRPLTYVAGSTAGADASTIVLSLPVGNAARATPLPYWPSYSDITPDQRAKYLDWLAAGKSSPDAEIGYVFIYFYGLEWRILRESADIETCLAEVERLVSIYGPRSASVRSYAASLITFAALRSFDSFDERGLDRMLGSLPQQSESAMALLLAWYAQRGLPLPARHAFTLTSTFEDTKGGVVVQRSRKELADLFAARYREKLGDGIVMDAAKRPLTFSYLPASATWLRSGTKLSVSLPHVVGRKAQFAPLVALWNQAVDELRRASSLKAKNAGVLTPEGWAALPPELRAQYDHPDRDRWDSAIAASAKLADFHAIPAEALAKLARVPIGEKVSASQHKKITDAAAELGYACEPDGRALKDGLRVSDAVLVWKSADTTEPYAPTYAAVYTMTALTMTVAMADGVLLDEETKVIRDMLGELLKLDDGLRRRLEALQLLLARQPAKAASIAKKLRTTRSALELAKLGRILVAVAAADGTVSDDEHKALRSLYKSLGLDATDLATALTESGAKLAVDDVVSVREASPSSGGEKLPPPPTEHGVAIDHAAVAAILADTRDVAAILAEVLDREEDEPTSLEIPPVAPLLAPAASAEVTALAADLDIRYHAVLEDLLTKPVWTKDEVRALASNRGLMAGAIVETINAWSDEALGDFLIEEEDGWRIRVDLVKKAA